MDEQEQAFIRVLAELEVLRMILVKAGIVKEEDYDKAVDEVEDRLLEIRAAAQDAFDCFDDDPDDSEEIFVEGKNNQA